MMERVGGTFTGLDGDKADQDLEFSIETMKSVYIRNTSFKIVNNKLIE